MNSRQFLTQVKIKADLDSTEQAEKASRAILSMLPDCLSTAESNRVKAQLPKELQDWWHKSILSQILPISKLRKKTTDQFLTTVQNRLPNTKQARNVTWAVFDTLKEQITPDMGMNIANQLPDGIEFLWQTPSIIADVSKRTKNGKK